MQNIEDVIRNYFTAYFELESLVRDKAKGDWNKAVILINNDEQATQIYNNIEDALRNFRRLTSEVGFAEVTTEEYFSMCDIIKKLPEVQKPHAPIAGFLEHFRDEWEWKIEEGHIEDGDILDALDAFFNLPNYDPDGWLRRKFLIGGIILVDNKQTISKKTETAFKEACIAFLYGLNLATLSIARSALESALKESFLELANQSLGSIINNGWYTIDSLRQNTDLNDKARRIMRAGNQVLHQTEEARISHLLNELYARSILQDLREILEFLYC
jgi:hypothetical protein